MEAVRLVFGTTYVESVSVETTLDTVTDRPPEVSDVSTETECLLIREHIRVYEFSCSPPRLPSRIF